VILINRLGFENIKIFILVGYMKKEKLQIFKALECLASFHNHNRTILRRSANVQMPDILIRKVLPA